MTFTGSFKTEHTMEDALRTEMRTSRAFFTYFLLFSIHVTSKITFITKLFQISHNFKIPVD